ncbi:hypothetical protein GOP47_0026124 [Adiantum capillus-veneris]|uniref:Uncharacterized protein n=1 Tax=Adiantum capillus-veneris TaxID=13818 RepID=A0A9D4U2L3_ADICA|nr:hypothetical protein GOP47_0026124 [Adiantum capillus-veneris]
MGKMNEQPADPLCACKKICQDLYESRALSLACVCEGFHLPPGVCSFFLRLSSLNSSPVELLDRVPRAGSLTVYIPRARRSSLSLSLSLSLSHTHTHTQPRARGHTDFPLSSFTDSDADAQSLSICPPTHTRARS